MSNTVPLPVLVSVPPLPVTVIRELRTTLSEEARNALNLLKCGTETPRRRALHKYCSYQSPKKFEELHLPVRQVPSLRGNIISHKYFHVFVKCTVVWFDFIQAPFDCHLWAQFMCLKTKITLKDHSCSWKIDLF